MRHVAAADVEQPAHRVRVRDDQCVGGEFFHLAAHAFDFVQRLFAGVAQVMRHHRAERRCGPRAPDCVDRIVGDRRQAAAGRRAGLGELLGAVDRVQPRRIAERLAGRQVGLDPGCRRPLHQMFDGETRAVDFLGDLHLVAAVDEDRGAVGEHDGDAGRAGEAGEPGEPLGVGRHIFVLVAVGARHDEAVEPAPRQLGPQQRQPLGARAAFTAILERLKARFEHRGQSMSRGAQTPAWSSPQA